MGVGYECDSESSGWERLAQSERKEEKRTKFTRERKENDREKCVYVLEYERISVRVERQSRVHTLAMKIDPI